MDEVSNNSTLSEDVKSLLYNDLLQDHKSTMFKSKLSKNPLLNLPVYQNALSTRTTSLIPRSMLTTKNPSLSPRENIFPDPALVQAISLKLVTSRS